VIICPAEEPLHADVMARGLQRAAGIAKKVIEAADGDVCLAVREVVFERAHSHHGTRVAP
jgi:hypothetical protein